MFCFTRFGIKDMVSKEAGVYPVFRTRIGRRTPRKCSREQIRAFFRRVRPEIRIFSQGQPVFVPSLGGLEVDWEAAEMRSNVDDPRVATYRFMTGLMDRSNKFGKRWTPNEEHKAVRDYKDGISIELIAERLGRSVYATRLRVFGRIGKWKTRDRGGAALRD